MTINWKPYGFKGHSTSVAFEGKAYIGCVSKYEDGVYHALLTASNSRCHAKKFKTEQEGIDFIESKLQEIFCRNI